MSGEDISERKNQRTNAVTRRGLLRTGVAASSVGLFPSIVSGNSMRRTDEEDEFDKIINQALKIRGETGSQEKFKRFLTNHTDYAVSKKKTFAPKSANDVSTQAWNESAITTDLYMAYYYDRCTSDEPYAYIDYYVTIESAWDAAGEGGPDQITLNWADHHYRYQQGSAKHDTSIDHLSLEKESLTGCAWEWKDGKACSSGCGTKDFYVACRARLLDADQSRAVQGSYYDMHEEATVESVSFTTTGDVQFEFSTVGETDQYGYQIRDDGDASSGC